MSQWILGLLCFTARRAPRALVWPGVTVTGGLSEWGCEEHCVVITGGHSLQPAGENLAGDPGSPEVPTLTLLESV